ncbi:MAG: protease modulator HflC [Candidatus Omnitrophica bacterium]|nr:protease modulator HflC [Candidatus Omnitrophota bacterium]
MNKVFINALGIAFIAAGFVAMASFYVVDETQQVVLTQFGKPIGAPVNKPGLHFKIPFIQVANVFDKRLLAWDGDPNQIPTLDKRYIWVDTTARWRIVDALKFMQSVGTEAVAQARLDDLIDSATRDVISNLRLVEAVRNSDSIIERMNNIKFDSDDLEMVVYDSELEPIKVGREELSRRIVKLAAENMADMGIELIDVRIKRITYVNEVLKKVYERMVSERKRAAEQYRSMGQGKKAEIEGRMAKDLEQIQSEAYKKAQEIQGKGDAEATRIYAQAYNQDPEFYSFLRTLEAYGVVVNDKTSLILNSSSDFYKYFNSIK